MRKKSLAILLLISMVLTLHASVVFVCAMDDGTTIETLDVCSKGTASIFKLATIMPEPFFAFLSYKPFTSLNFDMPCTECQVFTSGLDRPPAA